MSGAGKMYGAMFHAVAKVGRKQELLDFLRWDAQVARDTELNTISFDLYENPLNAEGVYVYECYRDEQAFAEHRAHEPFQQWQQRIRVDVLADFQLLTGPADSIISKD
jgi:quinol monooxygenase YgiN